MKDRFKVPYSHAELSNIVEGKGYRLTMITDRLLRVETNAEENFVDLPSQAVWFRGLGNVDFSVENIGRKVAIRTGAVEFVFNGSVSGPKVKVHFADTDKKTDASSKKGNLKGTRRTLDACNGKVKIGHGMMSKNGVSMLDDSSTYLIADDGTMQARKSKGRDFYVFAYGTNYVACLKDFYRLTGFPPLLPRYALGNWWSRYYAYTEESYMAIMDGFKSRNIPITVATIDMDWHWVHEIPSKRDKQGRAIETEPWKKGWTGYSWNTKLFPDPARFLKRLKDDGYKVTMNLHPADGVRAFEDMYQEMATAMGIDPASGEPVKFDMTDPKFVENYLKILHHPYEEMGVDFWWIDWQQGKKSNLPGLDPLWLLNHYHYLDSGKSKRPLVLSRYAKIGSHRYPLGFSGDTFVSWASLRFQPYFTSTAANVGYTWWSHDIGGHMMGRNDQELYLRWLQFGVFNPINRLHSTKGHFYAKEPWLFSREIEEIASEWLRLRQRLMPYIYTMNRRSADEGRPICEPLYYTYPDREEAYSFKNEYFFGSELLVCPITKKSSRKFRYAASKMWLPEGTWTDIFTGEVYEGGKARTMFRDLNSIPVLAKAGAIIPMQGLERDDKPKHIDVHVYKGNGVFNLYDDDGDGNGYKDGNFTVTRMSVTETLGKFVFKLSGGAGSPIEGRTYRIFFQGIASANVSVDGGEKLPLGTDGILLDSGSHVIVLSEIEEAKQPSFIEKAEKILQGVTLWTVRRNMLFKKLSSTEDVNERTKIIKGCCFGGDVKAALLDALL